MALGKGSIKVIHGAISEMFTRLRTKLIGKHIGDRRLAIGTPHELSLLGLYQTAAVSDGSAPDKLTMESLQSMTESYLNAHEEIAKARVVNDVNAFIKDARAQGIVPDTETVLGGVLADTWTKVTADVQRVVETQVQHGKALGALEGAIKIAANNGIDDPTVFFVIVRDEHVCDECMRLHMLEDKVTPRCYKLSQVGNGFHKRGDEFPKVSGLHPHCRCALTTLMPGWGFVGGKVAFRSVGWDEYADQQGLTKAEAEELYVFFGKLAKGAETGNLRVKPTSEDCACPSHPT